MAVSSATPPRAGGDLRSLARDTIDRETFFPVRLEASCDSGSLAHHSDA